MSRDFQIIQLDLDPEAFKRLPNRQRNQLVGCMHAHNELVVLNRLLMFSLNDVGDGELHNDAQGVQMWTILQVLTGKLFETWNLIAERFLGSNPEDSGITGLSEAHKKSLDCGPIPNTGRRSSWLANRQNRSDPYPFSSFNT